MPESNVNKFVTKKFKNKPCDGIAVSIVRCCLYYMKGRVLENNVRDIQNEYFDKHYSSDIEVCKLEKLMNIGISVINRDKIVLHPRCKPFRKNIIVCKENDGTYTYVRNSLNIRTDRITCAVCRRHYGTVMDFHRHKRVGLCREYEPIEKFTGGGFLNQKWDLWVQLAMEGVSVTSAMRIPNTFVVYDFEAMFHSLGRKVGTSTVYINELTPICFALNSNIPGEKPQFHVSESPEDLLETFYNCLNDLSAKAFRVLWPRYRAAEKQVMKKIDETRMFLVRNLSDYERRVHNNRLEMLFKLIHQLQRFVRCIPVIGFNSQRFDVSLIKKFFAPKLVTSDVNVIKRGQTYMAISTRNFRMIDCSNFISPGHSLASFLHSYLPNLTASELKGSFCYEWLDDFGKLKENVFPSREHFYSSLKKSNISESDYQHALSVWNSLEEPRTMLKYLKWYNELDCKYMVSACEKIGTFWADLCGADPWRSAISLPGISQRLLYKYMAPHASILLPTQRFKSISQLIDDGIVGGPSIIFQRYCEKDRTKIKEHVYGDEAKWVKSVITWDANSLYPYTMCYKPMPCENYVHFTRKNDVLLGSRMHKFYKEELEWIAYQEDCNIGACSDHKIIHKFNGGPLSYLGIELDGFCISCQTIYCYNGSKFHGRCDKCPPYIPSSYEGIIDNEVNRAEHERKFRRLQLSGHKIISSCSCEWIRIKKQDKQIRAYYDSLYKIPGPLRYSDNELLTAVRNDTFFGLLRVQIQVPNHLLGTDENSIFHQFPPFFLNDTVKIDMLPENVQRIAKQFKVKERRLLLSCLEADRFVVISPLLKYYLDLGFIVSKIYEACQFLPKIVFKTLGEEIYHLRLKAESDNSLKLKAETIKLAANACYGKTVEQVKRHRDVHFIPSSDCLKSAQEPRFCNYDEVTEHVFEVIMKKKRLYMKSPKIIGVFILGYAKMHLLQFAYTIGKFVADRDFAYMLTDTDSLMVALSIPKGDIDGLIKPNLRSEWFSTARNMFFPENESPALMRKFGLFKTEFCGTGCVALNSKTYIVIDKDDDNEIVDQKVSHKGVSKRLNQLMFQDYLSVLQNEETVSSVNTGFKRNADGRVFQYETKKNALSPLYMKRIVLDDNVHTVPLRFPDYRVGQKLVGQFQTHNRSTKDLRKAEQMEQTATTKLTSDSSPKETRMEVDGEQELRPEPISETSRKRARIEDEEEEDEEERQPTQICVQKKYRRESTIESQ